MKILSLIFLLSGLTNLALAQTPTAPPNENPVTLHVHLEPLKVNAGQTAKLTVEMDVAKDHHSYRDSIRLTWASDEGVTIDGLTVAPTKIMYDRFTKKERETIEDQANVVTMVKFPASMTPGHHLGKIKFVSQSCSERYCLFPKTVMLDVPFEILGPVAGAALSTSGDSSLTIEGELQKALSRGKFWAYIFVFIGGFLTSLTPCVFPMIPITISIIGARSTTNKRSRSFALSLAYVLGIGITYASLGVVAASTGALFGSVLSNPWVVSFIGVVFLVMGLSMLGLFELQVPASLRNRFGNAQTGTGLPGAFLAGLFAGIVASPCIGPVLVSILAYVAKSAEVFFGFTLLFTFAMGMGILFIVLGTFSGLLSKIPKAGGWMNATKYIFGFTFIGLAIYYVAPLFSRLKTPTTTVEVSDAKLAPVEKGVIWEKYSDEKIKGALSSHQPVIIDFFADWCAACRELDHLTYTNPELIEKSEKFVRLKFDATVPDKVFEALQARYGVIGLPTVIFINSKGEVVKDVTVTGFAKPDDFIRRMNKTLEAL